MMFLGLSAQFVFHKWFDIYLKSYLHAFVTRDEVLRESVVKTIC